MTAKQKSPAAYEAGCRGRSALPMSPERRLEVYGLTSVAELTPAQRRRFLKKCRSLFADGGESE